MLRLWKDLRAIPCAWHHVGGVFTASKAKWEDLLL